MGECAHAVAGLPTEQTNEILDALVKMYEKDYKTADQGKFFAECYDTVKVVPTDEYLEVYDKACAAAARTSASATSFGRPGLDRDHAEFEEAVRKWQMRLSTKKRSTPS